MPHRYGRYVEEEVDGGGAGGGGTVDPGAGAGGGGAPLVDPNAGGGGNGAPVQQPTNGKVITMPTAAVGRMKQEQRALGKKEAQADLDAKAKAAGFSSLDEALSAAAEHKKRGSIQQPRNDQRNQNGRPANGNGASNGAPNPNGGNRRDNKTQQVLERERRQRIHAERKAKEAQANMDAESARFSLERSAWGKGIRDTDYAITLLTRHCEGLTDDDLNKFDEALYFDGLRKTHPFLFGEVNVPANSGVGGNGAPPPPDPAAAARGSGAGAPDVRKMNKVEYDAHLRAKGYTPPSAG